MSNRDELGTRGNRVKLCKMDRREESCIVLNTPMSGQDLDRIIYAFEKAGKSISERYLNSGLTIIVFK